jgi:hypothetical protein
MIPFGPYGTRRINDPLTILWRFDASGVFRIQISVCERKSGNGNADDDIRE